MPSLKYFVMYSVKALIVMHGLISNIDTKAKMSPSKKNLLKRDFAAGVYQSLQVGDTASHVGILDPAL